MTKLLITGANGQVGWCLKNLASSFGFNEVVALGHKELDITDKEAVDLCVRTEKPEVIINAAAYTAVDRAESDIENAEKINTLAPGYLATAAKANHAVFLHISTDYVFNGKKEGLYKEDDPYAPLGVYGTTKMKGEEAVLAANPNSIILRTAWGFCEHGNNFVKTMLRLALSRDVLGVVSDQYGAPTYAGDIATALLKIGKQIISQPKFANYGIYHFTGYPYVNWHEFAMEIFNEAEKQGFLNKKLTVNAIGTKDYPTLAERPANSKLSCEKILDVFGIQPSDWKLALKNLKPYLPEKN